MTQEKINEITLQEFEAYYLVQGFRMKQLKPGFVVPDTAIIHVGKVKDKDEGRALIRTLIESGELDSELVFGFTPVSFATVKSK